MNIPSLHFMNTETFDALCARINREIEALPVFADERTPEQNQRAVYLHELADACALLVGFLNGEYQEFKDGSPQMPDPKARTLASDLFALGVSAMQGPAEDGPAYHLPAHHNPQA